MSETATENLSRVINNESADSPPAATQNQESWVQTLPEDLRGAKSLAKFNGSSALAKSYLELERSLEKRISLPNEDASDEKDEIPV